MNPLRLSPLPANRDEESESWRFEREGFVDEAVVAAMAHTPKLTGRTLACSKDLILSADDLDFAGWQVPAAPWQTHNRNPAVELPSRRPTPPSIREPGLGQPHRGGHRWWLAGLAGALATLLFSLLLLTLATRHDVHFETLLPRQEASTAPAPLATPATKPIPDLADTALGNPRAQRGD